MERSDALQIVHEYVNNENLVRHMLAVEAAMRFYAAKLGENADVWGITGILHDFDWEIHPTLEQHPSQERRSYVSEAFPKKLYAQF